MEDINALLERLRSLMGGQGEILNGLGQRQSAGPTDWNGQSAQAEIGRQMSEMGARRPGDRSAYDVANKATAQFLPNVGYSPGVTPRPTVDDSPMTPGLIEELQRLGSKPMPSNALPGAGARPMGPAVMPPNMTKKPMPLGNSDMVGALNDLGMKPQPAPESPSPRIPKAGGGRNLQRVSPGVYRNQKGGLVQRKTGGR